MIKWSLKYALGFVCYCIYTRIPFNPDPNRFILFMVYWSGFYAYSEGYRKDTERPNYLIAMRKKYG